MATGFKDARQQQFVAGIAAGKKATQAAIDAGFSAKSAHVTASRLLKNANIRRAVNEIKEAAQEKAIVTAAEVLTELKRIAMVDIKDIFNEDGTVKDINNIPEDVRRAISSVEVTSIGAAVVKKKYKFSEKNMALSLLGRHLKLYTDVVEHHGLEGLAERMAAGAKNADTKRR